MVNELRLGNSSAVNIRIIHGIVLICNTQNLQRLFISQGTAEQAPGIFQVRHRTTIGGNGIIYTGKHTYLLHNTIHCPSSCWHDLNSHTGTFDQCLLITGGQTFPAVQQGPI